MEKRTLKQVILGATTSALLLGGAYYWGYSQGNQTEAKDSNIAYIDGQAAKTADHQEKTPDQVSAEEGIDAEQIVVKITDDGYVTSHGDHYHYYNGKVPFDAIISEDLVMKDPNYRLNKKDIINEVKDGYIIKVDGKYYLYLKDPKKAVNVRTKEEIAEQKKLHHVKEDGAQPMSQSTKQALAQAKAQGRYTTDDGYVFTVGSIVSDTGDAYICAHGDHFHYVPKADLSPAERAAAAAYLSGRPAGGPSGNQQTQPHFNGTGPVQVQTIKQIQQGPVSSGQGSGQAGSLQAMLDQLYAQPKSQRHVEADGLIFDPAKVTKKNSFGYVMPHGDHYHIIPADQLSDLERRAADAYLKAPDFKYQAGSKQPAQPKESVAKPVAPGRALLPKKAAPSPKPADQAYTTDDGYVFKASDIIADEGDVYVVPHGDHFHAIPKADLSAKELAAAKRYWQSQGQSQPVSPVKPAERPQQKPDRRPQAPAKDLPGLTEAKRPSLPTVESKPQASQDKLEDLSLKELLDKLYVQPQSQRHVEADGLVFDPAKLTKKNSFGYVMPHGDHYHIIPADQLSDLERLAADRYLAEQKGAAKEESQQIAPAKKDNQEDAAEKESEHKDPVRGKELPDWCLPLSEFKGNLQYADKEIEPGRFRIPHHDHYHYADRAFLNVWFDNDQDKVDLAIKTVRFLIAHPEYRPAEKDGWGADVEGQQAAAKADQEKTVRFNGQDYQAFGKGLDGKPYTTDDGYTFSAASITEVTKDSVIAKHGDHFHVFEFGELEQDELRQVEAWMKEHGLKVEETAKESPGKSDETASDEELEEDPLAGYHFHAEDVSSRFGQGYIFTIQGQNVYMTKYNPTSGRPKKSSELTADQVAAVEAVLSQRQAENQKASADKPAAETDQRPDGQDAVDQQAKAGQAPKLDLAASADQGQAEVSPASDEGAGAVQASPADQGKPALQEEGAVPAGQEN
ncbi:MULTISPECIES: pneumococcal-type histidine triad protein [Aerococcus]|uniref:Pneumococcal-type histidine triad protein n=2 Tax=Aerococcus TaxID=1375 RepID=A0A5N1GFS9_9LACT|nr:MULTISPECIES: pneumococcal-type histidine triad protein [Aerococcus]KAA9299632.1 pneumococcal-type histidine triad protein [Aerococcus sanguinicola]MDK6369979.1 pneumococcal-type histidine triad protein [Aerococcus sp. UMB9870]MDK6680547.1 pneumococcal-type histidine triad protein [Aerococcus sp. UMB8608]MDK6687377.1 pneumococcal-type histidine triad protein [Aerococcus sp. UMB8623]MDK6940502.1 pneumococcal-type histidine triad protein [Aerococcus sp. UMB8487]